MHPGTYSKGTGGDRGGWDPPTHDTISSSSSPTSSLGKTRKQEVSSRREPALTAAASSARVVPRPAVGRAPRADAATSRLCCQDVGFGFCFCLGFDLCGGCGLLRAQRRGAIELPRHRVMGVLGWRTCPIQALPQGDRYVPR